MPDASAITAVLGPTNTGKTHRAVERMLEHDTGMIGLPLRLLAREVYDRLTVRLGESRVALVTGEEKRVPRRADYFVCTVEAMPIEREVDFLAVDEVQLAAHDQRGHVFTDRLLRARGKRETWFLGADTIRPVLAELVPAARATEHPRLSRLSFAGAAHLAKTPPRSAVVAFSTAQVYELAERLRALRGGAAVVLGALSPRTRNAQVAMFQAGEVDYLVATDAIGMGLNLDVSHVAFAALRKFDGKEVRGLEVAELAQIAGRAGRYLADGTFGTVAPIEIPPLAAQAIEAHRFPPVERVWWRNADLDFASVDALLASLEARPRSHLCRLAAEADDAQALRRLARDPDVAARARGAEAVELLWEVCRIPDYKKLLFESHVALLGELYAQLAGSSGRLDRDFVAESVAEIDDTGGDLETLTGRIASIRTWTYIAHQTRWVERADELQDRARAIEDRLSDALHDRLVQRFVERRAPARGGASKPRGKAAPSSRGAPPPPPKSHPFAALYALRAALAEDRTAAPSRDDDAWVEALVTAPHERFTLDASGRVLDGDRAIGKLARGQSLVLPDVKLVGLSELGAGARSRVLRRLVAFARDAVEELLAPLRDRSLRALGPAARGLVYQLEQGLGTAPAASASVQLAELDDGDREALEAAGITIGARAIYLPALLRRGALDRRVALVCAWFAAHDVPLLPTPGAVSVVFADRASARAYAALGYLPFGPRAVRADVAERASAVIAAAGEGGPEGAELASILGCPARDVPRVVAALAGASASEPG
jgi:ATP-dependent RNA helicase SUPV3L1/SUV3